MRKYEGVRFSGPVQLFSNLTESHSFKVLSHPGWPQVDLSLGLWWFLVSVPSGPNQLYTDFFISTALLWSLSRAYGSTSQPGEDWWRSHTIFEHDVETWFEPHIWVHFVAWGSLRCLSGSCRAVACFCPHVAHSGLTWSQFLVIYFDETTDEATSMLFHEVLYCIKSWQPIICNRLQNSWHTLQNFGIFLMNVAPQLKKITFAKFPPSPPINVDHSFRHYGHFVSGQHCAGGRGGGSFT